MKKGLRTVALSLVGSLVVTMAGVGGVTSQAFDQDHINAAISKIYETSKVTLKDIPVMDNTGSPVTDNLSFTLFDTTIQEFAGTVTASNGVLAPKQIIKGHHYMMWLNENYKYVMEESYNGGKSSKRYFTLNQDVNVASGVFPMDDKQEKAFNRITLIPGETTPREANRVNLAAGQYGLYSPTVALLDPALNVQLNLAGDLGGAKLKLTSQYDTVYANPCSCDPSGASLEALVYEDINYAVSLEGGNGKYKVLSTLITNKDHSEQRMPIYTYTHYTCSPAGTLYMTDDENLYNQCKYPAFKSQSGKTSIDGITALIAGKTNAGREINQGSNGTELIFMEKTLNSLSFSDPILTGKALGADFNIVDIDAINLHRDEICKMPSGDYTLTTDSLVPDGKVVDKVYAVKTKLDSNKEEVFDSLEECEVVSAENGKVSFKSSSVSLYNNVITYKYPEPKKGESISPSSDKKTSYKVTSTDEKKAAVTYTKTKSSAKKITIPATIKDDNGKSYKVTAVAKNALKGNKKVTTLVVGKNATTIGDGAFQNTTKLSSVKLEGKVTKIGKNTFSGAKKLKSVTLNGNAIKSIGKNAFKGVKKNCKITIQVKNKKQYEKVVKLIKKSGAKNVKYVYKKKKA